MVDFAGWAMPVLFTSILEEHRWTRTNIGMFDVSHMGRLELTGPAAVATLEALCTRRMADLPERSTRYCLMCTAEGGTLDDLMVSRLDQNRFYVVCNASNREKIVAHLRANLKAGVTLTDRTFETAMLALQGPQVAMLISRLIPGPLVDLPHRKVHADNVMGVDILAFRGGYTGEDGFEVVLPATFAPLAWMQLLAMSLDGQPVIKPAGLGARDTLRLEAALPLYGHELTETIDPLSARLDFAVDFEHTFLGKESLARIRQAGPAQVRVGLRLESRRAARAGFKILHQDQEVGTITSGAFTPTVDASIAMGYLRSDLAGPGSRVEVPIGTDRTAARVVPMPFYRRA
jgi:aminomethyltransferase